MTIAELTDLVTGITDDIAGRAVDKTLEEHLNRTVPAGGELYARLLDTCRRGVAEGLLCTQGDDRRRFGRVVEPGPATHGFSVDVVEIDDLAGPHHRHPTGEIDLVMPVRGPATFDGRGAGWVVYGPGTKHRPTVRGGRALILYLLPNGEIEFTV